MIIKWEVSDIVHGIGPFAHLAPEMKRWASITGSSIR
jgi:hypothetical protein